MSEQKNAWLQDLMNKMPSIDRLDPHVDNPALDGYLRYYHFDRNRMQHYRAGLVTRSAQDLFVQCFYAKQHKGTVFLVHGYLDHSGGLSRTINVLLGSGYTILTVDLPGHGLSQGEEGSIHSFQEYNVAVRDAYHAMVPYMPSGERIGMGHSTGAAILFQAAGQKDLGFDRLVLAAPLYLPYQWKKTKGMIKFASRLIPRSKRTFKRNSDDERYHLFITHDPLQVHYLRAEWFFAMATWQEEIRYSSIVRIPVYLVQGQKDTTVDSEHTIAFYSQKCRNIQVCMIPEARHQILNERQTLRKDVHRRILSFLDGSDLRWRT